MALTVNYKTLQRLAIDIGDDNICSLLEVFSDELHQYHYLLQQKPSINKMQEISYAIKNSAASFGADKLAELAQECEVRGHLGQDSWLKEHLPALAQMLEEMASEYKQLSINKHLLDSMR